MKKTLFLFIYFASTLFMCGQQAKIDSLNTLLKNTNELDKRLDLFEALTKELFYIDIEAYLPLTDSIIKNAKKVNNTKKLALGYNAKGRYYFRQTNVKEAKKYYLMAISLYKTWNDSIKIASIYSNIGGVYLNASEIDSAKHYLNKALEINEPLKDYTNLFFDYYNLGVAESINNQSERASHYIIKALHSAEKINNKRYIAHSTGLLGVLYMEQQVYDKAKLYLEKALVVLKELEDNIGMGNQYINLGKLYNESTQDYNKAITYYKEAAKLFGNSEHTMLLSVALGNTGRNYIKLNQLDSAKHYIQNALKLSREVKNKPEIGRSLTNLAEIALKENRLSKANRLINEALRITDNNDYLEDYAEALHIKANINKTQQNYKEAYLTLVKAQAITDSINSVEKLEKIADIETKYQTEKKEKENLQLQADKAAQAELLALESKRKWQLGAGLLTALLTLAIFVFYYRRHKKQKDVIESLQKELHHRIKNNLSIIDAFIEVAKEEFEDEKFSLKLSELQNRIDSINEVHQQLYKNKDVTNLNLKNYIDTLSSNVSNAFSNQEIFIEKKVEETLSLDADKSFPVGLIINEFLTNSYKYAFGKNGGKIKIAIHKINNEYHLCLSDNGKGLPENFNINTTESFGLRIIKLLSKQLNGTFNLQHQPGVQLTIKFPK